MSASFNYNTITRPILAGRSENFDITGTYVQVMEASHSDFTVRIDHGAENFYGVGIMIGDAVQPLPFKTITIVNYGADLDITIAHGSGPLRDGRVSFPGGNLAVVFDGTQDVNVLNLPATQPVSLPGTQNVKFTTPQSVKFTSAQEVTFANIARLEDSHNKLVEIVAKLSSPSGLLSRGFTDLTGASYATCAGNTVILATAVANTNGVKIHRFAGSQKNNSYYSGLYYDAKPITLRSDDGVNSNLLVENIFLPAGKKVEIISSNSGREAYCWYEVL